jgi:hypothetical protein
VWHDLGAIIEAVTAAKFTAMFSFLKSVNDTPWWKDPDEHWRYGCIWHK